MGSDRRAAGLLALVALSFVVGGLWLAAQPDAEARRAASGDAAGSGDAASRDDGGDDGADGPSAEGARTARTTRGQNRRAAYVPTAQDVKRDAARQALVDATQLAATLTAAAANVRAMVLPGAARRTPEGWKAADVRLAAAASGASATALRGRSDVRRAGGEWQPYGGLAQLDDVGDLASGAGSADPRRHGLRADYYDFLAGDLLDVPDLATLPPTLTRVDPAIDFATDESFHLPFDPETFGALWRGYVVIDAPGEYEFTAGSDDGVRVTIGGTRVVEYGALRPYAETSGRIHLDAGRHALEVAFYENYVFASCRLWWTPPGGVKAIVPASAFEPPDEIAAVDPPRIVRVEPPHAALGEEVEIRGSGFSPTVALNRVTFAGVAAEIVAASPTSLVVKVPIGASSGPLVVQVGPISTPAVPFEVDTLVGLYGEYFLVGTELSDYPPFDQIAPYFVRLDGPLDFSEDDLWAMPYEPDVFGVRWSGFLHVPEEDEYELTLLSDDGAEVVLDGQRVLDLPGLHPPEERTRTVALAEGFHPIAIRFFENYGLARLSLFWKRRGDPSRTPIPRGAFFAPDALALREEPRIAALEPATAKGGDTIVVRGSGFGSVREIVRVEFPGTTATGSVWMRPDLAADDQLTVKVPLACGPGPVRVHVGVRPSNEAAFALSEPIGLRGDYFELTAGEVASAADLPALLATRSPSVSRIDTRWIRQKREDWDLPFAARPFAVRWTGTVASDITQGLLVSLQNESAALLRVAGADIVADVEPHTLRESIGGGRLTPGEHAIELYLLATGDAPRLLFFLTPWGRAEHLELPSTWLRPRAPR